MNKERRKLIARANEIVASSIVWLEEAKTLLEQARDEEQEFMDNMPENIHGGEKYSDAEEQVNALQTGIDEIDNFTGSWVEVEIH